MCDRDLHQARPSSIPRRWASLLLPLMVTTVGCDSTFEPLEESQWVFSIAGHLEPSADTQWVRVNALRPVIDTDDEPIDALVTLEELETGRVFPLTPVLDTYRPIFQEGEDQYAFNYWTAEPIRAGFSYRLVATRSDGASSSAVASIPSDDFTVTYGKWVQDSRLFRDLVFVQGVPDLAMVLLQYPLPSDCSYPSSTFYDYQRLLHDPPSDESPHVVQLDWDGRPSILTPLPPCRLSEERIVVVASGDTWPFTASTVLRDLMHPNMVGNVENGTGYLSGLLIQSFPREDCALRLPLQDYCEVRYTSTSASLEGTVLSVCEGFPLAGADVRLEEVDGNRIRRVQTDPDGGFRIEGLEPNLAYRFYIAHTHYSTYENSPLIFEAAEKRRVDPISLGFDEGSGC